MAERLKRAASPYLLQHADDPVDWWPWCPEAFAEARRTDRPVLLSVGYAACHWCHVMAEESFRDPAVAELINRHFVAVKVDREERPDVDAVYQQALALLGEPGGWPLTMFLTPEGEPFWGGTYFPREPRYGRPGFRQLLERIAALWREERGRILENRRALLEGLSRLDRPQAGELDAESVRAAAEAAAHAFDAVHGGLGDAPKFPQAPALRWLHAATFRFPLPLLRRRLLHTLARMGQGGIYDHLGGGFHRYAVDAYWLVPHFEKMLYDNALLVELLAEAHALTGDPLFAVRAEETVGWMLREMRTPEGLAASLDADSEGEEGRFYLWTVEEVEEVLGPADAAFFVEAYGMTRRGNFEGRCVLHRLHEPGLRPPEEEVRLAQLRRRLLAARERRPRPARDDKVLADWNGLAVAGLVQAGRRLGRPEWIAEAARIFADVVRALGEGDALHHAVRGGIRSSHELLDDYVHMARAALSLFEATGEEALLGRCDGWLERARARFREDDGSWRQTPRGQAELPVALRAAADGPVPSAIGLLPEVLARRALLSGAPAWCAAEAESLLRRYGGDARRAPLAHATLLASFLFVHEPVQVRVHGEGEAAAELLAVAERRAPHPAQVFHVKQGAEGGTPGPAAVICRGPACGTPLTDPAALVRELRALDATGRA